MILNTNTSIPVSELVPVSEPEPVINKNLLSRDSSPRWATSSAAPVAPSRSRGTGENGGDDEDYDKDGYDEEGDDKDGDADGDEDGQDGTRDTSLNRPM